MKNLPLISVLWLAAAPCLQAAPLTWQSHVYKTHDKQPLSIPCQAAQLTVPEDHANPGGAQVGLALFRLPSTNPQPGTPIIYLHGGPGGSSMEHLESPDFRALFTVLRTQGDVILLDQCGCGQSTPSFLPKGAKRVQAETLASRENLLGYLAETSTSLRDRLRKEGHDPAHYTLPDSVADIEALRQALGVAQVDVFAHSYGTQLAQAYARQHPSAVAHLVLAGSRGMDTSRKLPAEADAFLARIAELAKADATVGRGCPELMATLDRVLARLDRTPLSVELEGSDGKFTLKVGGYALRFIIAKFYLNDPDSFKYLPKLLDEIDRGRRPWSLVFNLGQIIRGGVSFVWFTTDAASGVTPARAKLISSQATTARLQDAVNFPFPEINQVWGIADLGDAFRAPVRSAVPTLFVAGTLDGITPLAQTREIMAGFSAARLLVVENGGHISMLRAPGVPEAMAAFFAGREPAAQATLPAVAFMPLIAAQK